MPFTAESPAQVGRVRFAAELAAHQDAVALIGAGQQVSYLELAELVDARAHSWGVTRRLVLVEAVNTIDAVVTYLAALSAGHPVLLSAADRPEHVQSLIEAYGPDLIARANSTALDLPRRTELHPDLALLLRTSGSTGSPKLVRLSHQNVQANAEAIAEYLGIRRTDRAVTTLPMHYCYGLSILNSHLLAGASIVLADLSVVDPCFWDLFTEQQATTLAGVPYTFELLDRIGFEQLELPHLRYVTQAGGRMDPELVRRYARLGRRRGWDLVVMYGQTEATARMAYLPADLAESSPHTIGRPVPGGSFTLAPMPDLTVPGAGELVYTGPNVMLGYATGPADLALGATIDRLHTGDIARRTDQGLFEVIGRRSRVAKVFGLRLDLDHLEAQLTEAGATVWCVDAQDALVVATEADTDVGRLQHEAARRCGLPVSAVRVYPVPALPRLANGKADHAAVRALVEADRGRSADAPRARDPVALFAELLDRPDATADSTFVSLGGDSLSYVEMSVRLEDLLGEVPANWHTTRLGDLVPAPERLPRRGRAVETSIVLRAVAIVLVVGTHIGLFDVLGGAHLLFVVAGFNFARFHLTDAGPLQRLRRGARSVVRIAAPSILFIAAMTAFTGRYGVRDVLLLDGLLGRTSAGRFWFVETLLYVLVAVVTVMSLPAACRAERRFPFALPVAVALAGLVTRSMLADGELGGVQIYDGHLIFWLFALGWAAASATTQRQRVVVTALTIASVPGFSGSSTREAVVVAGLALLVWTSTLRVPAVVVRPASVLAASSLYVYLVHWHVFPAVRPHSATLALALSLAGGVAYWWAFRRGCTRLQRQLQMTRSSAM